MQHDDGAKSVVKYLAMLGNANRIASNKKMQADAHAFFEHTGWQNMLCANYLGA